MSHPFRKTGYAACLAATIRFSRSVEQFSDGRRKGRARAAQCPVNHQGGCQTRSASPPILYSAIGYGGSVTGQTVKATNRNSDLVLALNAPSTSTPPSTPISPSIPTPPTRSPAGYATIPNAVSALSGLSKYAGLDPALLNLYDASLALDSTPSANRAGVQLNPANSASAG